MDNRLYLITGASGLLGGNILKILIERGSRVRVLIHEHAMKRMPKEAEIIVGDLLDTESLLKFFTIADDSEVVVIHAAGIVTLNSKADKRVYEVNVTGTANIIEQCIKHQVKKLVYISSTSAIPELVKGERIHEVNFHDSNKVIGYYSKTKAEATELVLKAVRDADLDASVIYPSGIFGPNDYGFGLITSCIKMIADGKLRIAIGGTFNSVDVRDLAGAIISCVDRGRKGETYIMAGQCYTFKQLADAICYESGQKKIRLTIPLRFLRSFTWVGVLFGKLTKQPPWLSSYTIYNLERNNDFSSKKAEKELGFCCRPLFETIRDTVEWLRFERKIF